METSWDLLKVTRNIDELDKNTYLYMGSTDNYSHASVDKSLFYSAGIVSESDILKLTQEKLFSYKPYIIYIIGNLGKTTIRTNIATLVSDDAYGVNKGSLVDTSINIINNLNNKHKLLLLECDFKDSNELETFLKALPPSCVLLLDYFKDSNFIDILTSKCPKTTRIIFNKDLFSHSALDNNFNISISTKDKASIYAENIVKDVLGTTFSLNIFQPGLKSGRITVTTTLLGTSGIYNSLFISAVLSLFGNSLLDIKNNLIKLQYPPSCVNILRGVENSIIVDDTCNNHTGSLIEATNIVSILMPNKKVLILGTLSGMDASTQEELLASLCNWDIIVVVGDTTINLIDSINSLEICHNKPIVVKYSNTDAAIKGVLCDITVESNDIFLIKGSIEQRFDLIVSLLTLK